MRRDGKVAFPCRYLITRCWNINLGELWLILAMLAGIGTCIYLVFEPANAQPANPCGNWSNWPCDFTANSEGLKNDETDDFGAANEGRTPVELAEAEPALGPRSFRSKVSNRECILEVSRRFSLACIDVEVCGIFFLPCEIESESFLGQNWEINILIFCLFFFNEIEKLLFIFLAAFVSDFCKWDFVPEGTLNPFQTFEDINLRLLLHLKATNQWVKHIRTGMGASVLPGREIWN